MNEKNSTASDSSVAANSSQRTLIYIILAIAAASLFYRITQSSDFKNTSILFVGLPTLISILVAKSGTPESTQGLIFKVITLFLLISAIILGEGILCIVMAAPIFYFAGFLVGVAANYFSKDKKISALAFLPLLVLISQPWNLKDHKVYSVSTTKTYTKAVTIDDLAKEPNFLAELPAVFQHGFPKPVSIEGSGLKVKDQRKIDFVSSTKGKGSLVLEISEIDDHKVVFSPISDDTHIGSWLTWQKITVSIEEKNGQHELTWSSQYTCNLGPQWYFQPIEEKAIEQMHHFLMESYFE